MIILALRTYLFELVLAQYLLDSNFKYNFSSKANSKEAHTKNDTNKNSNEQTTNSKTVKSKNDDLETPSFETNMNNRNNLNQSEALFEVNNQQKLSLTNKINLF